MTHSGVGKRTRQKFIMNTHKHLRSQEKRKKI